MGVSAREWLPRDAAERVDDNVATFTVVSYNILAQVYVRSGFFPYCPRRELRAGRRRRVLLDELCALDADIFCLQEVDCYSSDLAHGLAKRGYCSAYKERPGRKQDGCAIFFRTARLECVATHDFDLNDIAEQYGNNERLLRDNVGLCVALKVASAERDALFVVATTHLFWDPNDPDVKVLQAQRVAQEVFEFAEQQQQQQQTPIPVVLTGDLNSMPDSEPLRLLREGAARVPSPPDATVRPLVAPSAGAEIGRRSPERRLVSAYAAANGGAEAEWTNKTPGFTATIDYILVEQSPRVRVRRVLGTPPNAPHGWHIPNEGFPSDHIPVVAEVSMVNAGGRARAACAERPSRSA